MNASDRCDRCGAQAYTAWWLSTAKALLLLCGHHAAEHELALVADGWELTIDDRATLLASARQPEPA